MDERMVPTGKEEPDNEFGISIDADRDKFHINWVKTDEIGERLSAQSYRYEILEALHVVKKTSNWKRLKDVVAQKIKQGRTPEYANEGIQCIKTRNIRGVLTDTTDSDYVSKKFATQYPEMCIGNGTVLMNRSGAGSIGRSAVYLKNEKSYSNEELFHICLKPICDECYVTAFLSSRIGGRIIEQGINGSTGQLKLTQKFLESVPIVLPSEDIQRSIGNKVRKAERLKDIAIEEKNSSVSILARKFDFPNNFSHKKQSWVEMSDFDFTRLDAEFYQPHYLEIESFFKEKFYKSGQYTTLKEIVKEGGYGVLPPSSEYNKGSLPFLRSQDLGQYLIVDKGQITVPSTYYNEKAVTKANDILLEVKGEISGGAVCLEQDKGCLVNGSIFRMQLIDGINPFYVLAVLLSPFGIAQKKRAAANSIISYLSLEFLNAIKIPRLNLNDEISIGEKINSYIVKTREQKALIRESVNDINLLITGKLDENKLIAKGKGIENWLRDNPSPYA